MFEIRLIKNDASKAYNITPLISSVSWDSNLSLRSVIEFSIIWNDTVHFPANPIELGDLVVILKEGVEVNRGIVVNENLSGRGNISYTAYDYAWYLGKSKSVYQFNLSAKQAVERVLNDFGMPIGNILTMSTKINKVYIQQSPAEIIKDIIKQFERETGNKVLTELREGKIYIENMMDMIVIGTFKISENVQQYNILSNPLGAERTRNIEDMRNRIKIILTEQDNFETIALEQDTVNASRYGLLEETFKIDAEDSAKARQVAKILLKRLNKIHETNSITLMGDVKFKAGRLFDVVEPLTGMQGRYMITECKHEVNQGQHIMNLTLTLPEDVI
ncbi:hypothetical protein SAMN05446037_100171 [Anaerovirgula multivorans]|uniref:YqbQ/XkdQ domain-containing protein n=1 Tax=Anaerovirgula multivorans TaxID=312168 RepID=A0A238ZRT7_9FIRM|nr:hypothetical protein [Anaerovirgula multivorans]SNR86117.1 hypothetical protein SAMN05446037_100171 [Anaerovirgula multivorans]